MAEFASFSSTPTPLDQTQSQLVVQVEELTQIVEDLSSEDDEVVEIVTPGYTTYVDEVSDTVTYVGKAIPGSSTAAGVWQLRRLTLSGPSNEDLTVEFADGTDEFTKIWDNRAGYGYS